MDHVGLVLGLEMSRLVERVVIQVHAESESVDATIHWQGGYTSQHEILRPVATYQQLRDNDRLRARVVELHGESTTAAEIARTLGRGSLLPAGATHSVRSKCGSYLSGLG
jgi:hypothetical protein